MIIGFDRMQGMGRADRREYRRAVPRVDRLAELVDAVGGTAPCVACTRVVALAVLRDGLCPVCRRIPAPAPVLAERERNLALEPGTIYVDASWRDGHAGLAVVGTLGEHSRKFLCRSNVAAEVEAMRWALHLARGREGERLLFRSDSQSAAALGASMAPSRRRPLWAAEWVPRRDNRRADQLSRHARLAA